MHCKFATPKGGPADQKSAIEDMLAAGYQGIAISPIEPANQTAFLDKVAKRVALITQDSDAPDSARQCFIGVDNYAAGRLCGQLVKAAIPEGGKVMMFVGQPRPAQRGPAPPGHPRRGARPQRRPRSAATRWAGRSPPKGSRPTCSCRLRPTARTASPPRTTPRTRSPGTPDLACMIGLFAYNTPTILEALKPRQAARSKVKVVGFDERARRPCRGCATARCSAPWCRIPTATATSRCACWRRWRAAIARCCRPSGFLPIEAKKIGPAEVDDLRDES